jgi:hypothetical protein
MPFGKGRGLLGGIAQYIQTLGGIRVAMKADLAAR